ncbi:UDP-N-acetylglucosamine--N-acetylmuramyl-(pentapeptide) pyrophosphoryl-undecaprenol N-acetylglucosamine transferase [Thermotoga sp. Ku-13t]|uniref:UDP-N-acetylglucosamine--N-acetylmuramyl- (pentapeptide) pyrophosphoryl-undecaprenol N-acetylglucosamine transferase n=1 Tax=Thermotoga sp. Ku-13t TaxID=1755813 RepID=UPI0013EC0982|nr:UDP-N-acetylglucosamine--N-acetylmuramyl-(pentapeptide) pyrophosphoryl-undecaprenol N-acetylglucosamine transferase [Thermotoga sp. Ku-13t]KAF2957631.1 UDP-N-acetylglucosamine--N-acetylmuramyl-(pentapeptide) pyrophosphoryl-undecaprenol N-acetylglucosamine transferase [Thermotoga sp. Ku-13t]
MKILAAGGVTGGHLYPALAILEELSKHTELNVVYFCTLTGIENRIIPREHPEYKLVRLDVSGLERPLFKLSNVKRVLKIIKSKSIIASEVNGSNCCLVTGGYVSYPVGSVCGRRRVPLYIQEQNVVPGIANRTLGRYASKIFVGFEEAIAGFPRSVRDRIVVTGNPIRITSVGQSSFGEGYVLVLGGSRGSALINAVMEKVYQEEKQLKFVHSTGDPDWTRRLSVFENVLAVDYIYDMTSAWRGAVAAVCRAGALTVSELLHYGVPAVLIPWEGAAEGHQVRNAQYVAKIKRGMIVRENEVTPGTVLKAIRNVLDLGKVAERETNPASTIAKIILEECV